jgi:hypothetical protein
MARRKLTGIVMQRSSDGSPKAAACGRLVSVAIQSILDNFSVRDAAENSRGATGTEPPRLPGNGRLRDPAGQHGGLLRPRRHLRLVELVVLMNVEVARFRVLGPRRGEGTQ